MDSRKPDRLIIAEDNKDTRELLKEYFESLHYSVTVCKDGMEALELLKKEPYTILISDIRMPKMDGITLVKEVKKLYPQIGVIMMTAYSTAYTEEDIRRVGIDDYISKPFNFENLKEKVERLIIQVHMMKPKKT